MGNKSSKPKQHEWQQQVDQEPEFNPPYGRPSRAKAPVDVAHSMDEIRESSGFYVQSQQQQSQEQEMVKIRASALVPITSQVYYAPTSSQSYYVPTSPQSYHAPTSPQAYQAPTSPRYYHAPTSPQYYHAQNSPLSNHAHNTPQPYYALAASNHERDMALIRESSGAHLR
ncbi:hypothetical protein BG000_009462 [Podila horticola]|nr:hypothetical protein BG000_009462 [Podila horticola]